MKIFAFIMALLVLSLSIMPCMDACKQKANPTLAAAGNHQAHNGSDDCSPFCSCSCCASSVIHPANIVTAFQKPIFRQKQYALYLLSFYSTITSSIWQPPKLA